MAQPILKEERKEERSLGDLFTELATESSTLIRQEIALAQSEITRKATRVGTQIGFLVVGGAIGYAALLVFLAAAVFGLSRLVPDWAAALIVGAVVAVVAAVLVTGALKKLRETDPVPRKTVESLKEGSEWLKDQVS